MRTSDGPMKKRVLPEFFVLLLACVLLVGAIFLAGKYVIENSDLEIFENYALNHAAPPESVVVDYLNSLHFAGDGTPCVFSSDGTRLYVDVEPSGEEGMKLYRRFTDAWSFKIDNATSSGMAARVKVYITCPDTSLLSAVVSQKNLELMQEKVSAATSQAAVYDARNEYLADVRNDVYTAAMEAALSGDLSDCTVELESMMELQFYGRQWHITNETALSNTLDKRAYEIRLAADGNLPYFPVAADQELAVPAEDAGAEEAEQPYDAADEVFQGLGRDADV